MNYRGFAFHDSLPDGRTPGTLGFADGKLTFTSDGVADVNQVPLVILNIMDLDFRIGGAADRFVIFIHPSMPGWSVQTAEKSILNDPALLGHGHVARARRSGLKSFWGGVLAGIALIALIAGLCGFAFSKRDELAGAVVARIPREWDQKLGETAFKQVELTGKLQTNPEALAAFRSLAKPLLDQIKADGYRFQLHIQNDPTVNAFALPGGIVVFNSGLIEKADRAAELQGVLAHEIAHVTERHSMRNLVRSAGLFVALQVFLGDISGTLGVLLDNSSLLLNQAYSRSLENQADEVGFATMQKAGLDTSGMIDFFLKLRDEQAKVLDNGAFALLSSHPATEERLKNLRKLQSSAGTTEADTEARFDLDFKTLKSKLSK